MNYVPTFPNDYDLNKKMLNGDRKDTTKVKPNP